MTERYEPDRLFVDDGDILTSAHRHLGTSPQKYRALFTHDPAAAQAAEPA